MKRSSHVSRWFAVCWSWKQYLRKNAKLHEIEDYFVEEKQYVIPLLTQNSVVLVQDGIEGLWLTVGGSPIVYNISVK